MYIHPHIFALGKSTVPKVQFSPQAWRRCFAFFASAFELSNKDPHLSGLLLPIGDGQFCAKLGLGKVKREACNNHYFKPDIVRYIHTGDSKKLGLGLKSNIEIEYAQTRGLQQPLLPAQYCSYNNGQWNPAYARHKNRLYLISPSRLRKSLLF